MRLNVQAARSAEEKFCPDQELPERGQPVSRPQNDALVIAATRGRTWWYDDSGRHDMRIDAATWP
jgi:hypothetical protein